MIATGLSKMHKIVEAAPPDISRRLWTLYWLARMTHSEYGMVVELGVRKGDSTRTILCACEDSGGILHSFDIEDVYEIVIAISDTIGMNLHNLKWCFHLSKSVPDKPIKIDFLSCVDLVFIDTDHTLATTRAEIAAWHPHVRVGGVMVFHDYFLAEPPRDGVQQAVNEFAEAHKDEWRLEVHEAYDDVGLAILWRLK